jgi:anti-sigma regulatory factor (Ser/Thr protein kinase)
MESGWERVEVELAVGSEAPREARRVVGKATARLAGDLGFRARLAASELVANSVTHAVESETERVRLTVMPTGTGVRVEVRDTGDAFDGAAREVSERATSGRGLRLVDVLVDRWGVEHEDGNVVWFEIDEEGGDRSSGTVDGSGTTIESQVDDARSGDAQAQAVVLLARAAQRVREGWCQHVEAVDHAGTPVDAWSDQAAAWSLLGAVVAALDGPEGIPMFPLPALATAMSALAMLIADHSLSGWNDAPSRTQDDVVAVLERARMVIRSGRVQV